MSDLVETYEIELRVNGQAVRRAVPVRRLLADFLREDLRLQGTHLGCEHGVCGACTIVVDGAAVRSCLLLAVQADGCDVLTIEGISPEAGLNPIQQAFKAHHALQCGFCTPGFVMTLHAANPDDYRTDDEIRELLSGNLCRCTGYQHIVEAVRSAWTRPR